MKIVNKKKRFRLPICEKYGEKNSQIKLENDKKITKHE
jgi:hypothetical protein